MPPFYELAVARFVHAGPSPSSPSSTPQDFSHWAITVTFSSASGSLLYQIIGTHADYSLAAPASITLSLPSSAESSPSSESIPHQTSHDSEGILLGFHYAAKAPIGYVDADILPTLHATLTMIPVVHGDPTWGSRDWVLAGVNELKKVEGFFVEKQVCEQWISDKLGET
ncbi:hypothetical protein PISMIDRAFT_19412 [Pisolithus microcarpus 441]|uniref:Unplaced genomic scaffold scaffold_505, whole genome shotgun sequence n=1 Tax=Pisolithus microcarpus 441 TaxID=765257 RepID=A0A0C9XH18_9AGAM|nr:hypothetical protein BKA83DRAFT_19412 [Pisolithus microcarpus]KIK11570.1 hypothetical protein PISMIDRAFT_19412 [Pisolithus microcarpus 441]